MWVSPKTSESPSGFRCWFLRHSRRQVHRPSGLIWSPWNLIMLVSFSWIVFVTSSVHDDLNVYLHTTHILHFTSVENWPNEFGESKGLWELPPHSGSHAHPTNWQFDILPPPPAQHNWPPCRIRSTVQWNQLDPRLSHHNLKNLGWKGKRLAPTT